MYFCRGGVKILKIWNNFFFSGSIKNSSRDFCKLVQLRNSPRGLWQNLIYARVIQDLWFSTCTHICKTGRGGGHFFHNFWASFFVFRLIGYQNWWKIWMQLGPAVLNVPSKTKKTSKRDSYFIFKFLARMYPKVPRNFLKVPEISLFVHLGQKYRFFANRPKCPKMSF